MQFKKINDSKFQCIINQEDMDRYNFSLEDFITNDPSKIQDILEIVMDEAYNKIGIDIEGTGMSLQVMPHANSSILLIVSGSVNDGKSKILPRKKMEESDDISYIENYAKFKLIDTKTICIIFDNLEQIEEFCMSMKIPSTLKNDLYKLSDDEYFLIVHNFNLSKKSEKENNNKLISNMLEYGNLFSQDEIEISGIVEYGQLLYKNKAMQFIKKYLD